MLKKGIISLSPEKCPSIRKMSLIFSKMSLIQEKCPSTNLKN